MSLVSIVIPTHNRLAMLENAVASVFAQTYENWELLITSDGSSDGTNEYLKKLSQNPKVKVFFNEKPSGASSARNLALTHASGSFIAFLDDDDVWMPEKLAIQVPMLVASDDKVGLVYAWMEYYRDGKLDKKHSPTLEGDVYPEMLWRQAIGGCPTIIIKSEVVEKVGLFNEKLLRGNDGDYWRRISKHYHVICCRQFLAKINIGHDDRISENNINNLLKVEYAFKERLKTFEEDFARFPEARFRHNLKIVETYLLMGEFVKALQYFFGTAWGSLSPRKSLMISLSQGKRLLSCALQSRSVRR
ncbi:MAG: glycosyltransferase family 2 protein [Pseudobacteriovorax sp.]|nr:glycosyltransferase family 2 protein [Pseudobacteriovorax sp.]